MKLCQLVSLRSEGFPVGSAQFLLVRAGFIKSAKLLAIAVAQRSTPDGLQKQNDRLVPGVRHKKTVPLLPGVQDALSRQDGEYMPACFSLKIYADELTLGVPKYIGIIDVTRA